MKKTKKYLVRAFLSFSTLAVLLGAIFFFKLGCFLKKPGYNVLLLTLDTTRADHLRCYGYWNIETPALNRLAREGVIFLRAYAHLPMTLPAHTSILSGTYPLYNGVVDNGGYRVPDEIITLPEVLKEHGYTTAGFISAAVLKRTFNLNQGFEYWNEEDIQPQKEMTALVAERKADRTTDAVLKWLGKNYHKKFFLWVHYYDPHMEYDPPEPYRRLYYFDRYSGEIAFMDSQIKRLFEWMEEKGLFQNTIIVAIGDHGESLGEHEEMTHSVFLYEATQHIPFLVYIPGLKNPGRVIKRVVSQIDLMPTVLELLGLPIPEQVQGRSLKDLILGKEPDQPEGEAFLESHFPFLHYGWSELYSLVTFQYKYIQAPKPELYELSKDPGELKNLAEENPKLVKELDYKLEQIKQSSRSEIAQLAKGRVKLDDETRKQLLALGYLTGKTRFDLEEAKKKNPRDYASLLRYLNSMQGDLAGGRYRMLLNKSEKVLEKDPNNSFATRMKASALFGMGRYMEAVEWIEKALKVVGEDEELYSKLGTCYLRLNQKEKAKKAFEKALELEPEAKTNAYYLARIYLVQGDEQKALELIDQNKLRETVLGHIFMANYYLAQGRVGRAEAEFELAVEQGKRNALVYGEYGNFLLMVNRPRRALELIEKAEELDPSFKNDFHLQKIKKQAEEMLGKGS